MELRELGLSKKTANTLRRYASITSLEQLRERMAKDPMDVEHTRRLGPKGFKEIQKMLRATKTVTLEKPKAKPDTPQEKVCSECGKPLKQMRWNTAGDILICDNLACNKCHQPQGWILSGHRSPRMSTFIYANPG